MDDLLQRVPMASLTTKKTPLLVEVPVHGAAAPFLVSGTLGWAWVEGARTGVLRAAVRTGEIPPGIFPQIVSEVARRGVVRKWMNGFPFAPGGLLQAVAYVRSYGIEEVEALVPIDSTFTAPKGVTLSLAAWVPSNQAVIVPLDRTYLGMLGTIGDSHWMAVVHNPSRGMAVLGDW